MSGDCDFCGSYDHVEAGCPTTRLNHEGGCVRCGLIGCEWANGDGTQHRVVVTRIPVTADQLRDQEDRP